jgi:hypothetical protein
MAFFGGYSGAVTMTGTDVAWKVGRWKLRKSVALPNVTNSASGGIKQRKATIKDQQATFELPWDDTINPEASGFAEGAEVKCVLNLGSSTKKYTTTALILESFEYDNDEDEDVIRVVATGYANVAFAYS